MPAQHLRELNFVGMHALLIQDEEPFHAVLFVLCERLPALQHVHLLYPEDFVEGGEEDDEPYEFNRAVSLIREVLKLLGRDHISIEVNVG